MLNVGTKHAMVTFGQVPELLIRHRLYIITGLGKQPLEKGATREGDKGAEAPPLAKSK